MKMAFAFGKAGSYLKANKENQLKAAGYSGSELNMSTSSALKAKKSQLTELSKAQSDLNTTSSALNDVQSKLDSLVSLAAQATDPGADGDDLDSQAAVLVDEIKSLLTDTVDANGKKLLDGSAKSSSFGHGEVAAYSEPNLNHIINQINNLDLSDVAGATAALDSLSGAKTTLAKQKSYVAGASPMVDGAIDVINQDVTSLEEAEVVLKEIQEFLSDSFMDLLSSSEVKSNSSTNIFSLLNI